MKHEQFWYQSLIRVEFPQWRDNKADIYISSTVWLMLETPASLSFHGGNIPGGGGGGHPYGTDRDACRKF